MVQKRIKIFRELVNAVSGHPALMGWVIMDRGLEWARPGPEVAEMMLKSYAAEIREKDENSTIYLGLGWSELMNPEMARSLANQMDGLLMSGLDKPPFKLDGREGLVRELLTAAYLGNLTQWLFKRPTEIEVGWGMTERMEDPEEVMDAFVKLVSQDLTSLNWLSLIDPNPKLSSHLPWVLRTNLDRVGLLNQGVEPKEHVEIWLKEILSTTPKDGINDFIDISVDEYLDDPQTHFYRLWDHFLE